MDPDLTIILLGGSGVGKSTSGNSILGWEAFQSKQSFRPVTTKICEETGDVFGNKISVIDTPGILDSEKEIRTWYQDFLQTCRPRLFLVVLTVGRFTEEGARALEAAVRVLGDQGLKNSFLLFTYGDSLSTSLEEYISQFKRGPLINWVNRFGGRFHLFNNKTKDQQQVRELLKKSEELRGVLGVMDVKRELLKTLEKLGDEDFTGFIWLLSCTSDIPKNHLINADRSNTVDKILETCKQQSVEVVKKTLMKMEKKDLVEELSNISRRSHDTNTPASSSVCGVSLSDSIMAQRIASSRYQDIISKCNLISSGSPAVYQLKPNKEEFGTLTRKTVGEKNLNKKNRNILLVGETGTGKSTLINALVNYTMGVKFEDNIWFEMVKEEKSCPTYSQTSDVIVYKIFGYEGKTLPYSLTIIDTPGFGDTRGIERDDIISHRLFDLFRSDDGVHELSAVGLVLNASVNRLNDRQMYIFDSVMSLFGKDIEENIVPLITHSDGITPYDALKALKAANIKCAKNEENETVHFLFDNCQKKERTEEDELPLENAWRTTERGMKQFTDFLKESKPQKLIATVEVLNTRVSLTACIQNLQERIQLIELKQRAIQHTEETLKKHEEEMKKNEEFTVEVEEVYKEIEDISGGMWALFFYEAAVTCNICKENCHYPGCTKAWKPEHCEVMKDGRCTVCTNKCPASDHVKEKWIYVTKTKKVQKTKQDMKEKYEENKSESEKKKSLMENLQTEMKELEAEKIKLLEEVYQHVEQLERIALNVNSLSTYVHLDFLIEKMKERRDTEKVKKLEEMKSRQDEETVTDTLRLMFSKLTAAGKAFRNKFK